MMEVDSKLWAVIIDSSTSFRNAIEIISNVLNICTFVVQREDANRVWLRVDAMDSAQVAAVKMKLCFANEAVSVANTKHEFSVKIKTLLAMLKTLPCSEAIEMYQTSVESVKLVSRGVEWHEYSVKALNETFDQVPIRECESEFSIEFEVERLKKMLSCCSRIKAGSLCIRVIEREENIAMCCVANGDEADAEWWFEGSNKLRDDHRYQLATREGGCDKTGEEKFNEEFDVAYLALMCKSMERNTVALSLSRGEPLILEYHLGQELSSVRFLLAPKFSDD